MAHVIHSLDVATGMGFCGTCQRDVAIVFLPDPRRPGGSVRTCPFDNPTAETIQAAVAVALPAPPVNRELRNVMEEKPIRVDIIDHEEPPRSTPKPPAVKGHPERDVQEAIVEALQLAGCMVMQTSAWRQRGPSGVTPGIPDLLVRWPGMSYGYICGIEVKAPKGKPTPEQLEAERNGFIAGFARSPKDALEFVMQRMGTNVPISTRTKVQRMIEALP